MFFRKRRPQQLMDPADSLRTRADPFPPNGFNVLVAETLSGPMIVNRNDIYIGQSLIKYGEYSRAEIELFEQWIKPGQVIVEVGANIGTFTVVFAQLVGDAGAVIAFEPQRLVYQLLCANVALQSCVNVNVQQMALGSERGIARIPVADPRKGSNFGGIAISRADNDISTPVEVVPQDTLDNWNLASCHFIKIDVEGMEADVLRGASGTLSRCRPVLYFENDREELHHELVQLVEHAGYDLYWHLPQIYSVSSYCGDTSGEDFSLVSINVLALPKELNGPREDHRSLSRYASRDEGIRAVRLRDQGYG